MYPFQYGPAQGNDYQRSPRILHILLVEDHDDTRKAMEMFLRVQGHRTQVAAGVEEALDLAAKSNARFDLLLSDLRLPDGTGWNLFTALVVRVRDWRWIESKNLPSVVKVE